MHSPCILCKTIDNLLVSEATYCSPCNLQKAPSSGAWFALVGYTSGSINVLLLSENIRTVRCPDRVYHTNALADLSTTRNPSGSEEDKLVNDDEEELPSAALDNFMPCCIGRVSVCLQHIRVSADWKTAVGRDETLNCSNMLMV